jgi:CRP/FNR family transcriptional regulator, polysaccharide utilization system transcription regulator
MNFHSESNCPKCTKKCTILNLLNEEEVELIDKNRRQVMFKAGEVIFKQGTSITHVVAFHDGLAKIYLEGYNFRDLILKLQKPGEIIAGPGLYVDGNHHFSMSALTNCVTCFIDAKAFKQVVHQNGTFAEAFLGEFARRSINTYEKFISLTQKQMHGRIADAILYLSDAVYHTLSFEMIISRQEIADMTAMTKESAVRILKQFEKEGIIAIRGNSIDILNLDSLRKISRTG